MPMSHTRLYRRLCNRWRIQILGILLAAIMLIVTGFVGGAYYAGGVGNTMPANPANPISISGCVIRFDKLSHSRQTVIPRIHADSAHMCVGVTRIAVDSRRTGDLIVHHERRTIVSLSVSPDETLVAKGISCGASKAAETSRIRCYDRFGNHVPAYSKKMYGRYSNYWLTWFMWHL